MPPVTPIAVAFMQALPLSSSASTLFELSATLHSAFTVKLPFRLIAFGLVWSSARIQRSESLMPATARVLTVALWKPRMAINIVGRGWLMTASTKSLLPVKGPLSGG